jgi:hypothetical protein
MPIRPELRYLYRGPAWEAARERIHARAQGRCEKCHAKQGTKYFSPSSARWVVVQLGVAHIDHEDLERFFDDDNLLLLCRACHLRFDGDLHSRHARETRQDRKDRERPLLGVAA